MQQQAFKQSQLYSWDTEPVDERPSEFAHSTSYAALSGHHSNFDTRRRAPQRNGQIGLVGMLALVIAIIAIGGWAIVELAPMLRH